MYGSSVTMMRLLPFGTGLNICHRADSDLTRAGAVRFFDSSSFPGSVAPVGKSGPLMICQNLLHVGLSAFFHLVVDDLNNRTR